MADSLLSAFPALALKTDYISSDSPLQHFRQGHADALAENKRWLDRDIGAEAAKGNYLAAAQTAFKGGDIKTGFEIKDYQQKTASWSTDQRVKATKLLHDLVERADTPAKWAAAVKMVGSAFGPEAVSGYEAWENRPAALTALQRETLKHQQQELALRREAEARQAKIQQDQLTQQVTLATKPQFGHDPNIGVWVSQPKIDPATKTWADPAESFKVVQPAASKADRIMEEAQAQGAKAEWQAVGKARAERYEGIIKDADLAKASNVRLAQLESLNEKATTGFMATGVLTGKKFLQFMGFNPSDLGLKDNIGATEALRALGTLSATDMVSLTKGAVSDKEWQGFLESAPTLGNTKQGNQNIIDFMKIMNARKVAIAQAAVRYRTRNGSLDEKFIDEIEAVHKTLPMPEQFTKTYKQGQIISESDLARLKDGTGITGEDGTKYVVRGGRLIPVNDQGERDRALFGPRLAQ